MSQEIIKGLVEYYKDTPADGIVYANARLAEILPQIAEDRVIFSNIEGNVFKWQEVGLSASDWFSIWTRVKADLIGCLAGNSRPRGVFAPTFYNIEH